MESQPQNPEFRINPESFHPRVQNFRQRLLAYDNTLCHMAPWKCSYKARGYWGPGMLT